MLYGLSRNLCQNSAKIVWTVRKYTQKYITAVTSISVPTNVIRQPWNACQYSQKLQLLFLFNFCAHYMLYDLHKSVRYGLFFLAVWNPYFSLLWDAFSPSANAVSFLQLDLSLALSCSLNKNAWTTQEWVRPLALVDLMREGEGFSNLTAEIRLDGWLRFGVSSLTLTLVIKSPFNLHLTN